MPRYDSLLAWGGETPSAFQTPASGTATNGLPYFSWDQAGVQLNREGWSWSTTLATPISVSYAFRETGPVPTFSGVTGFAQFNAIQIAVAAELLTLWAEVANITFTRIGGNGYSNNAAILFGNFINGPSQFSAFTYLPEPGATGASLENGDIWVNVSRDYDANPQALPRGAQILLHEIGHALGLLHPSAYDGGAQGGATYGNDADFWQDTRQFTVMTYFSEVFTGGSYGQYYVTAPQMFDIAAVQYLYGANMTTRTGDTVYGFNSNAGHDVFSIASGSEGAIFCIWDAGGEDTLDLSGYTTDSHIDLRAESFSSAGFHDTGAMIGNISIARGVVIENAIGGSGADTLIGNAADNILAGGAGVDTAVFSAASSAASFTRSGAGWSVSAEGADLLSGIEYVRFSDRTLALRPAEGSVDGAGSDLVLRNAATGAVAVWQLSGATVSGATIVGASDASYQAVASGDFNADGRYDVLFRNPSGVLAQWQFNGAAVAGSAAYGSDPAWTLAGVGDFNGDHRDDILWRHSSGVLAQWQMDGLAVAAAGAFAVSDTAWSLVAIADFNGDGHDDFLWRHSSGALAQWSLDGFAATNLGVFALSDTSWSVAGTGDFNGDLREDILWRHSSGVMALWHMDGTAVISVGAFAVSDTAWNISDFGDYNGDGRDDILWQGPDGAFAVWAMDGFNVLSAGIVGNPGAGWGDI
ncbi:MAG: M10 family metallopeptidase C-terminal domain-containing protein [Hyphomonadaceae bacterium]